jgi:hypothetical protein
MQKLNGPASLLSNSIIILKDDINSIFDETTQLFNKLKLHRNWLKKATLKGGQNELFELDKTIKDLSKVVQKSKVCIQVIENVEKFKDDLCDENVTLTSEIESKGSYIQNIKNIGSAFVGRNTAITSLVKLFEQFHITDVMIGGSFCRKIFELPKAMSVDIDYESDYGNPMGHDIDLVLFNEPEISKSKDIIEMMSMIQNYLTVYRLVDSSKCLPIKLGNYNIVDVIDITLTSIVSTDPIGKKILVDIPHFLIKASDDNTNMITFDIIGWRPVSENWPSGDFDVNCLNISTNGISINPVAKRSFFEILNHIYNKEAESRIDLEYFQSILDISGMTRADKIPHLNQISHFFADRLKVLTSGYKTITSLYGVPCFEIEEHEPCFITQCDAPYVNLIFECNHKLSIMAYIGEVTKGIKEHSESISCPQCRGPFKIKFQTKLPSILLAPSIHIPLYDSKLNSKYIDENKASKNLLSSEALDYIKNLYIDTNIVIQTPVLQSQTSMGGSGTRSRHTIRSNDMFSGHTVRRGGRHGEAGSYGAGFS